MTKQTEVQNDKNYTPLLDHGFLGLVDYMGGDESIVQAARVSYGKGTKTVNEDRGLIRYLIRNRHTSPLEMVETKWHLKLPIFVMRQLVRHRTANLNEISARFSIMENEFYIPDYDDMKPQSKNNKQGREGELSQQDKDAVNWLLEANNNHSYGIYNILIHDIQELSEKEKADAPYDAYDGDLISQNYPGLARELSRMVLPTNLYTECFWKIDLHNLFHFLRLRVDSHAQKEIRVYAQEMYNRCKELFPLSTEAFDDYILQGENFSRMEKNIIQKIVNDSDHDLENMAREYGLSKGETREFLKKLLQG